MTDLSWATRRKFDVAMEAKGWLALEEGMALYGAALTAPGVIVEIGSYCGKSTVFLGAAAQETGNLVFACDHHRGNPEMVRGRECHDPEMIDPFTDEHDTLLRFRRTVARAGLEDDVVAVVAPNASLARVWSAPVGMLFIDGDHSFEGCKADFLAWSPFVTPGGTIVFHDVTIPDIGRVAQMAADAGFYESVDVGCMRVMRRPE